MSKEIKKEILWDDSLAGGFIDYLRDIKRIDLDLDPTDDSDSQSITEIVTLFFKFIAAKVGESKKKDEPIEFEIPGLLTFQVLYTEDGWKVVTTAGEEFKKPIKLIDDDDDEDDDE